MTIAPFFILGYPRSRTAWLSCALSTGPVRCIHEALKGCVSLDELAAKLTSTSAEYAGSSDSANALLINPILARWPSARLVVITRDTDSVAKSWRRLGISLPEDFDQTIFPLIQHGIDRALQHGALNVAFEAIGDPETGRRIWEHCAPGQPFDAERWSSMDTLKIELKNDVGRAQLAANRDKFRQLYESTL